MSDIKNTPSLLKLFPLLDYLKTYTSEERKVTKKDLLRDVKTESRSNVGTHISALQDYYNNYNTGEIRIHCKGDVGDQVLKDIYYEHDLKYDEALELLDTIVFSPFINPKLKNTAKKVISEHTGLATNEGMRTLEYNTDFNPEYQKISYYETDYYKELKSNITILRPAINNRKIKARFNRLVINEGVVEKEKINELLLNPYMIIYKDNIYYLVCTIEGSSKVYHYRIELLSHIEVTDMPIEPANQAVGLESNLIVNKYADSHMQMYSGNLTTIKLKFDKRLFTYFYETFRNNFTFIKETETEYELSVRCEKNAMLNWADQYGTLVEVLEPADLRFDIKKRLNVILSKYQQETLDLSDVSLEDGKRNLERIKVVLNYIEKIWNENPDLRLGQLILNAIDKKRLYNMEDNVLIEKLLRFYEDKEIGDDEK